jgi:hypothetical protein
MCIALYVNCRANELEECSINKVILIIWLNLKLEGCFGGGCARTPHAC